MRDEGKEKPTGQIENELNSLQDTIADLETSLGTLLPKLDIICSESTPKESIDRAEDEELCTLAERIRAQRKTIRHCINSVNDYNERIEL